MPAIKASAKITRKQWHNLKLSSISGVSDKMLSKQYRIKESSIRAGRSADKEWSRAFTKVRLTMKSNEKQHESNQIQEVTKTTVESLKSWGDGGNLVVAKMAHDSLVKFSKKTPSLSEWSEASTAYNMLRKSTGQDKEGTTIGIALGAFWSPPSQAKEAEKSVVVDV